MSTRARLQPRIMPPAVLDLKNRLAAAHRRHARRFALLALIHLVAFGILVWSEDEPAARAVIVILIALSQFKHSTLMMTATFVDVMIIDVATFWFFIKVNPGLVGKLALATVLAMPVMVLLWRAEPFRVRRATALLGVLICLAALAALSLAVPTDREDEFYPHQFVSKFARSAAVAAVDLTTGGVLEA